MSGTENWYEQAHAKAEAFERVFDSMPELVEAAQTGTAPAISVRCSLCDNRLARFTLTLDHNLHPYLEAVDKSGVPVEIAEVRRSGPLDREQEGSVAGPSDRVTLRCPTPRCTYSPTVSGKRLCELYVVAAALGNDSLYLDARASR